MLRPGILLAPLPDGTFTTELAQGGSLRPYVGYHYMNSRLIHDQTFTGCSDSLMGCTQDYRMDGIGGFSQSGYILLIQAKFNHEV